MSRTEETQNPRYELLIKPLAAEHVAVLARLSKNWRTEDLRLPLEHTHRQVTKILACFQIARLGAPFDLFERDPDADSLTAYVAVAIEEHVKELPFPARVVDLPAADEALTVTVSDMRRQSFAEGYRHFVRWAETHNCELVGAPRVRLVTGRGAANDYRAVLELQQAVRRLG